jgi:hypothetical protein
MQWKRITHGEYFFPKEKRLSSILKGINLIRRLRVNDVVSLCGGKAYEKWLKKSS